jgi:hypothetical protein
MNLQVAIADLFQKIGIPYYGDHGQVSVSKLDPAVPQGQHLEFDGVGLFGRTCIITEITSQQRENRTKIHRFIRHCNLFKNADIPLRERFGLLRGIPSRRLRDFEDVNDWRYLYIGTSPELREHGIRPRSFSDSRAPLGVLWDEDWEYLKLLVKNIGPYAKGELLASIQVNPPHQGGPAEVDLKKPFICVERRRLARNMPKAEVFVAEFSPDELLAMCRVFRYQGFPMAVETGKGGRESVGYQRLLIKEKLASIRRYIGLDASISFPNVLTLVCSDFAVRGAPPRLCIPNRYASLDLIDGQHRLYAYAAPGISDEVRKNARLLAALICFDESRPEVVNRYAATTFVTINRNQAKVKTELIYLTAYDAMGEESGTAVAGKVLTECNNRSNGALTGLLRVRPLVRSTRGPIAPLPIVTIANELTPLVEYELLMRLSPNQRSHLISLAGTSQASIKQRQNRLRLGMSLIEHFFQYVRRAFPRDVESAESCLVSAKYFAALLRLFRQFALQEQLSWHAILEQLQAVEAGARRLSGRALAFPRKSRRVPTTKDTVEKIFEWFRRCRK